MPHATDNAQVGRTRRVFEYDPHTPSMIRAKVSLLVRSGAFRSADRRDVSQDLFLHLIERHPRFDPRRASLRTYEEALIRRRLVDLIRHRTAACRDQRRERQPDRDAGGRPTIRGVRSLARLDLTLDVRAALDALPPHLRPLAELLMGDTITGAARRLGLSRSGVRERCRAIAEHLTRAGLGPGD